MSTGQKINILIIGSGGREHALGWKIKKSPLVNKLYFAPGNAGTEKIGKNLPLGSEEIEKLKQWVSKNRIGLTVIGPEVPLSLGIVDVFKKAGLKIFGPTQAAAKLETDKSWAADFMQRHSIPHPDSKSFTDYSEALKFIRSSPWPKMVVKASGLAAGKGAIVCNDQKEILASLERVMIKKEFGQAGEKVVLQERLFGEEVSVLALTDGKVILPFLPAQDHKRIFDYDQGPNTGGMGAYAPIPFITPKLFKTINNNILKPTIAGMRKEGNLYQGVLYAGLLITKDGPQVIEFNARFGNPETQPLMLLLKSDLVPLLLACAEGNLGKKQIVFKNGVAICVVAASSGYPSHYEKGKTIFGLEQIEETGLATFHAGTIIENKKVVTNGGRVLGLTAYGKNLAAVRKKVYNILEKKKIWFEGVHYRTDIGLYSYNLSLRRK